MLTAEVLEHWVAEEKRQVSAYLGEVLRPDPEVLGPLGETRVDFLARSLERLHPGGAEPDARSAMLLQAAWLTASRAGETEQALEGGLHGRPGARPA